MEPILLIIVANSYAETMKWKYYFYRQLIIIPNNRRVISSDKIHEYIVGDPVKLI